MKYKKLLFNVAFLLGFGLTGIQAQEVITASGGEATGSNGTVSYTLGQLFYSTHSGTDGTIAEGVQQPYEISVVTGIEDFEGISLECMVYPNPTSNFLQLKVESEKIQDLSYQLFDMKGNLLKTQNLTTDKTAIKMENLPPSVYFLKLMEGNKEAKTFKIIKN